MEVPLTKISASLFGWFGSTFALGLFFGNTIFLYTGLVPLFILFIGLTLNQPGG